MEGMITMPSPTDQRAGVRPIAFVLQRAGSFGTPVTLAIRPEDLSRDEPQRTTVHQTLGRDVVGWADSFGEGLPSLTISGHTGWRTKAGSGMDGAQHFEQLNQLISHEYAQARQQAIEAGTDPSQVKLIFVDMLDGFVWNVSPMRFVLRRSKSRPLLFQYNIELKAISTDLDNPLRILPNFGGLTGGLSSMGRAVSLLWSLATGVESLVSRAVGFIEGVTAPVANTIHRFVQVSGQIMDATLTMVTAVRNGASSAANIAIGIANEIAEVGRNVFWTISGVKNLPGDVKSSLSRVASVYNELACILKNSLRPRETYDDYTGLYGASNCSSTTFGRSPSRYANGPVFDLMQTEKSPIELNSQALSSIGSLSRSDPVLEPIPMAELSRHVENINAGFGGVTTTGVAEIQPVVAEPLP